MIRYLIIDDEPIAHSIIQGYGDKLPQLHFEKSCYDAIEALSYLQQQEVDLIFLDLNLPTLKGFDFLKTLANPPNIIVTTAYSEFALEGYELQVVDYLLKPFSFERFLKAIHKIPLSRKTIATAAIPENPDTLFVKSDKKQVQLALDRILFIESIGNYCNIITDTETLRIRSTITDFLKRLPEEAFIQVHKSFIVAKAHIHTIEGNRITIADYILPIGQAYKSNITDLYQ